MPFRQPPSKYFDEFKAGLPDVSGKVFVITGTTSGTGFVAARTVAEKGGEVVCLNRTSPRVEAATQKLKEAVPDGKFINIACDLQDLTSVRQATAEVQKKYSSRGIYCLSFNAGVSMLDDKATKDGYDVQMQTNHLSHFLLCAELFPLLGKSTGEDDARVVFMSSGARDMTQNKGLERKYFEKNGGELGGNGKSMFFGGGKTYRYAQSKLANSVMMYALHEKLQTKNNTKVKSICAIPGFASTNLGDHMDLPWYEAYIIFPVLKFFCQSAEDGTMGLLNGMMGSDAESGVLYGPTNGIYGPALPNPPKPYENNPEAMQMLWEVSEVSTGVKFEV